MISYEVVDNVYRYVFYGERLIKQSVRSILYFIKPNHRLRQDTQGRFDRLVELLNQGIEFDHKIILTEAYKFGHHDAFRLAAQDIQDVDLSICDCDKPEIVFMYPRLIKNMSVRTIVRYVIRGSGLIKFDPNKLRRSYSDDNTFGYIRLFDDEDIKSKLNECSLKVLLNLILYNKNLLENYPLEKIIPLIKTSDDLRETVVILTKVYSFGQIAEYIKHIPLDYRYYIKRFSCSYEKIVQMFGGIMKQLNEDNPIIVRVLDLINEFMNSYSIELLKENEELVSYSSSVPLIKILECNNLLEGVILTDNLILYEWFKEIFDQKKSLELAWKYSSMNIMSVILDDVKFSEDTFDDDIDLVYMIYMTNEIYKGSSVVEIITRYPCIFAAINPILLAKYFTADDYKRLNIKSGYDRESFELAERDGRLWVDYVKIFNIDDIINEMQESSTMFMTYFIKYYPELVEHLNADYTIECLIEKIKTGIVVPEEYTTIVSTFGEQRIKDAYYNKYHVPL